MTARVHLIPAHRWILSLLLLCPLAALADKLGPDLSSEPFHRSDRQVMSAKMQALLSEVSTPEQALKVAKDYQHNGQFGLAKLVLEHGIGLSEANSLTFLELTDELNYKLQILQAKEFLVMGKPDEAEPILEMLASSFKNDKQRTGEIEGLRGALVQSRLLGSARRDNERVVSKDVRARISGYYQKYGVFPNYTELNKLLPADDKLLQNFEIIYFKSVPNAYRMILRNLYDKENLLKIEATGLIK